MSDAHVPSGEALSDFALDTAPQSFRSALSDAKARWKSGDLGSLPAVLAIIVLVTVFGLASDTFLTALNFANFLDQASSVIVIAMAVTFVLLLGEIDLAAGYTAGVAAAMLALRLQADWPLLAAIAVSALVAVALGAVQAARRQLRCPRPGLREGIHLARWHGRVRLEQPRKVIDTRVLRL